MRGEGGREKFVFLDYRIEERKPEFFQAVFIKTLQRKEVRESLERTETAQHYSTQGPVRWRAFLGALGTCGVRVAVFRVLNAIII